ncbi:MAG TPA: DinB family protein, partial [Gemmatimonadaceae bacterium]|nr:DinB family protein [Gemmatimonadaceae bacterium]
MHPRIQELLDFIDLERTRLRAAVDVVPPHQRGVSPGEGQWTVAGVLEHLCAVEKRIASLLRSKVIEARGAGASAETETSAILPLLELDKITDRTTRLKSPNPLQSSPNANADAAWSALMESRQDFRAAVLEADGVALGELTHPHLYFGPFTMYKWIGFIGA